MHDILEIFKNFTNADWINDHGGLYFVMFIIFAETGLFVGFFLPGDSLLFITGMIISNTVKPSPTENPVLNLVYWISLISVAGILGNIVGYWFGSKSGHLLMKREDSFIFKKKHLMQAHDFYEQKGGMAIFFARFVPIVRTFAPIVGGMVDMDQKKFMSYNILGCLSWVISMIMTGFFLGKNDFVHKHLELIVLAIILVTTGPVLFKMFTGKSKPTTGA